MDEVKYKYLIALYQMSQTNLKYKSQSFYVEKRKSQQAFDCTTE